MRSRTRAIPNSFDSYHGEVQQWLRKDVPPVKGVPVKTSYTFATTVQNCLPSKTSREVTLDENHRIHDHSVLMGGRGNDLGGPFDNQKWGRSCEYAPQTICSNWSFGNYPDPNWWDQYRSIGPVLPIDPSTIPMDFSSSYRRNLAPVGTSAIARCKPTNHVSNLAIDMAELYRGQMPRLPGIHLWKGKTRVARSIGEEYLNLEFGWKPLVSDIRNACYAAANSQRLMQSYENNSGKPVRRSYQFPVEKSESTSVSVSGTDGVIFSPRTGMLDGSKSQPHLVIHTRDLRETWFSGSFTYYLPVQYRSRRRIAKIAAQAGHLYGIELTPEVVWQAVPWTWAIDWFSNMGDIVNNLSDWATDGLVMNYGYVMEHIVHEVTYSLDRPSRWKTSDGGTASASAFSVYYESKQRVKATPFGFEIGWNGLSLRQLAIAAALGLTQGFR